jgi:ABC-2 type transport system ATP-binding protein
MKRRLEIARGLLHHPKVLFLDEPTLGLDPQTRNAIWKHVKPLREEKGTTVFMTTHYMEEAEHCDKIAIIDHGKIQAGDSPANLKRMVGGDTIIVGGENGLFDDLTRGYGVDARKVADEIHFQMDRGAEFIPLLVSEFAGRIKSIQALMDEDSYGHRPTHLLRRWVAQQPLLEHYGLTREVSSGKP